MTLQTSLNTPLPTVQGSLWIGNGTASQPSVNPLTAGSGINIDNSSVPGNITISAIIPPPITWQQRSAAAFLAPGYGYIATTGSLTFTLPTSPNIGDTYYITGLGFGYVIAIAGLATPFQKVTYNGTYYSSALSTATTYATIGIVYVGTQVVAGNTSQIFNVISTSPGSTFTGS